MRSFTAPSFQVASASASAGAAMAATARPKKKTNSISIKRIAIAKPQEPAMTLRTRSPRFGLDLGPSGAQARALAEGPIERHRDVTRSSHAVIRSALMPAVRTTVFVVCAMMLSLLPAASQQQSLSAGQIDQLV